MKHALQLLITLCLITPTIIFTQNNTQLGKTHFIVGHTNEPQPIEQPKVIVENHNTPYNLIQNNCIKNAYFSPDDDVRSVLLYLIAQETKSIRLAMFNFTEKKLAQALVNAQRRGVTVEIVIDESNLYNRYSKLPLLHQGHIPVFVYNAQQQKAQSLMHNKFMVFENNISGKSIVCTGSFNFTRSAHRNNQENVLIIDDEMLVAKYAKRFEHMKKLSHKYHDRNGFRHARRI